jgi:hypothetical protein
MLRPSHTNDFLDAWTFYLGDSRVNRLAQQDLKKELMTLATSTHTSVEESESADQELFSSKTLKGLSAPKQQTENQFSSMSSATWKAWVTEQRQEYSQRKKLAHLIRESESSSWATPIANDAKGSDYGYSNGKKVYYLGGQAKSWATPNTMDTLAPRSYEASMKDALSSRKGRERPSNLREQVDQESLQAYKDAMSFPTPRTSDAEGGRIDTFIEDGVFKSKRHKSNQTFGAKLRDAVESFPTPTASEDKFRLQGNSQQSRCLEALARTGKLEPTKGWPTPMQRDWRDTANSKDSRDLTLPSTVFGQTDQTNSKDGGKNHVLNPSWVEQLMGVPHEWTDFGSWETESCQTQLPKPSKY